ncbi:hypothetical protein BN7_1294 [Wickerhamomyces ciferrii]|uniref:Uncharacterized protein n=1 Tax=Wickerhamomyces ciferrii (strain ATCC 14091 / BCRC 22168 / CBS 111 / JCM 3599 / NBRC 0793 / NRRL Y-1031 F-60-10) TaxID=1206466 RepID=K0K9Z5_WICCF|nr:uncharacterized protein BN7_1294 [Wickerhamomyces ciferrii]CCH41755.1 hypothetical protein BN7_1294 [Wickerhamomyces ciferrii]
MQSAQESEQEAASGSDHDIDNQSVNNTHNNWTKNEKNLIEKFQTQMNYRIIPFTPGSGQNTVNVPLKTSPEMRSKIQNGLDHIPYIETKTKPLKFYNLKRHQSSDYKNSPFIRTCKEAIPVKAFYFMRSEERSSPLLLSDAGGHILNLFLYFRPAANDSIKSESDLRRHLIDSFTRIILDYYVKKDELENSNRSQDILNSALGYSSGEHDSYRFKPNESRPLLSNGIKGFNKLKLCFAFLPNKEPLLQTLETFINILTFGGEFKEIDAFAYSFENDTHEAFVIHGRNLNDDDENDMTQLSNLMNRFLYRSTTNSSLNRSNDYPSSNTPICFIPGISTYELVDPPPPSYQK